MSLTRRMMLRVSALGTFLAQSGTNQAAAQSSKNAVDTGDRVDRWDETHDRVWLGERFWANPMEDWRVVDGAAECQSDGGNRNVHLITHQLTDATKPFSTAVDVRRVGGGGGGGVGFRVGVRSELNEYRSNVFIPRGVVAKVADGDLVVATGQKELGRLKADVDLSGGARLSLQGRPAGGRYELEFSVVGEGGAALGSVRVSVPAENVLGNVSVVNSFDRDKKRGSARHRFSNWTVGGDAFTVDESRQFGAILWSMYTLNDSRSDDGHVLKMSALTGPLGESDHKAVELLVERNGSWESLGQEMLDTDSWTATFRIPKWDASADVPYRLVYRESVNGGGEDRIHEWAGTVKADPQGRPLKLAALTCQHHSGFPYEPVANNVVKMDPDLIYFSGDQLYEDHGGFGVVRDNADRAILNYLRKFYMFGWSFRDAMRNAPTLCIPDDHDVFQGNIWGEGGKPMEARDKGTSSYGGYIQPARMVNVVHQTNTGHHPDPFDPAPVEQDISVYYGELIYGDVSFAVLGDRQWKSEPGKVADLTVGALGGGRSDHVADKSFDTRRLDKPGLVLLGDRQEEFLRGWAEDWRGHRMKVVLSQTVFAGMATHHGHYDGYLKADLDSSGWPQTARDRAVEIMTAAKPLHVNGDQHLTSLAQYGVKEQRDGCWSFCTPAISAGYPRWWRPDEVGMPHANRPEHGLANTGEYRDGLDNRVYVYAVGDPIVPTSKNRYERAHQKGSGFGFVTIDTEAKTYAIDSFRFLIDPTDGNPDNQFPGWPVVIHQEENAGQNRLG